MIITEIQISKHKSSGGLLTTNLEIADWKWKEEQRFSDSLGSLVLLYCFLGTARVFGILSECLCPLIETTSARYSCVELVT